MFRAACAGIHVVAGKIAGLDTRVKECEGVIEELKRDKLEHEYERRKLHNTIQELKV